MERIVHRANNFHVAEEKVIKKLADSGPVEKQEISR